MKLKGFIFSAEFIMMLFIIFGTLVLYSSIHFGMEKQTRQQYCETKCAPYAVESYNSKLCFCSRFNKGVE